MTLVMYSLRTCPTCVEARREMDEQGVVYEDRIVDDSPQLRADVVRLTGQRTVPVFVKGDVVTVGFHGKRG
jgi:glutaredoxin